MNDGHIWRVGYCQPYKEWGDDPWIRESDRADHVATKDKHHDDGHATAEEACGCYRQYLLDHHLRLKGAWENVQHKCEVCGEWTALYAAVDYQTWNLCEQHNTLEVVDGLLEPPEEIWCS